MTAKVYGFFYNTRLTLKLNETKYLSTIYNRTNLSVGFQVQF